jgi:hypothetical protein
VQSPPVDLRRICLYNYKRAAQTGGNHTLQVRSSAMLHVRTTASSPTFCTMYWNVLKEKKEQKKVIYINKISDLMLALGG